jgi:sphingomyelin phosphodiesterase
VVIWTGDSVPHEYWEQTSSIVTNDVETVSTLVNTYLGATSTIFPAIGNHDTFPVNVYDFSESNIN